MKEYVLNMKPFQVRDIRLWFTEYLCSVSINYVTVSWRRWQWHALNWDFLNQGIPFHDLGYLSHYLDRPLYMTVPRSPPRTIISFLTMASSPDMGIVFSGAEWFKYDADHLSAVTSAIMNVWRFDYVSPLALIYSPLPLCTKQRRKYSMCKVAPLLHSGCNNVMLFLCHRNDVSMSRINVQYEICCLFILNNGINNS
jgi:hypothetical protein